MGDKGSEKPNRAWDKPQLCAKQEAVCSKAGGKRKGMRIKEAILGHIHAAGAGATGEMPLPEMWTERQGGKHPLPTLEAPVGNGRGPQQGPEPQTPDT